MVPLDISSLPSQDFTQTYLPPGQQHLRQDSQEETDHKDLEERHRSFNAGLIVKNNENNGDSGVHDVLKALINDNDKTKFAALCKIKKIN